MDFSQLDGRSSRPRKQLRPPPNYLSRSVQWRLLLAVGCLMLVVILMFEARKPENWRWMWARSAAPSEQVDTRLRAQPAATSDDPPGTLYSSEPADAAPGVAEAARGSDPLSAFRDAAWARCTQQLDHEQRLALDRLLNASRDHLEFDRADLEIWSDALASLDATWAAYLQQAKQQTREAGELPEEQVSIWLAALTELEAEWHGQYRPALSAVLDERVWTALERELLSELQQLLDGLDLQRIRDDTVWRPVEQHAWFRLLEQLNETDLEQLDRRSLGPVAFVQLFGQPNDYRGKLVTVRGTAKLAYRVPAPRNIHGIDGYYIFWLKPAGGQSSPLVVYALDTPREFPTIKDKYADGETTSLNEEVEFTAFFFKRWAYRAQDGLNTAPLLLAKAPVWERSASSSGPPLPSSLWAALSVAAVLALSLGLVYVAYSATSTRAAEHPVLTRREPLPPAAEFELPRDAAQRQLTEHERADDET